MRRKRDFKSELRQVIHARSARTRSSNKSLPPAITIPPGTFVDQLPLPKSYEDAITGPYRLYWIKAIAAEMDKLRMHGVWRLQKLPKDAKPISGKMVYKWKQNDDNTVSKAKARFTMLGYRQRKGRDYKKTYASVAALMTIYLTCIVGVVCDFAIHQTDLESAYLTAPIEPDVEMFLNPPPTIEVPAGMGLRVCKALYGSMQGAERLDAYKEEKLTAKRFIRCNAEPSLYFMPSSSPWGTYSCRRFFDRLR